MVRRVAIVAVVLMAVGVTWAVAQQPLKPIELQPKPMLIAPAGPAIVRQFEENVELLESQLDIKRAYVKAAEVALAGSTEKFKLVQDANQKGTAGLDQVVAARLERDTDAAQVEIRKAELNEVAVKLKHAKRRLEDAKGKPAPAPKVVPAKPGREVKELQAVVLLAEAKLMKANALAEKARAALERAKLEERRLKELVLRGIVPKEDLEKAALLAREAELDVKIALAEVAEIEVELRTAKQRLEDATK
jgi:multidrug resistance efflux pump